MLRHRLSSETQRTALHGSFTFSDKSSSKSQESTPVAYQRLTVTTEKSKRRESWLLLSAGIEVSKSTRASPWSKSDHQPADDHLRCPIFKVSHVVSHDLCCLENSMVRSASLIPHACPQRASEVQTSVARLCLHTETLPGNHEREI
jgi:hypothetical protein